MDNPEPSILVPKSKPQKYSFPIRSLMFCERFLRPLSVHFSIWASEMYDSDESKNSPPYSAFHVIGAASNRSLKNEAGARWFISAVEQRRVKMGDFSFGSTNCMVAGVAAS